ncbi:ATP-binding protein [bacterium]|nr:ATP-binding protein [bacterium]
MPKELVFKLPSAAEKLSLVRRKIRRFAESYRLSTEVIDHVELAVDEAVSNVIQHAYSRKKDGIIQIRVWKEPKKIIIAVRDYGKNYKPTPVSEATIKRVMKKFSRGGMGRYIMQICMDKVEYVSRPKEFNETVMWKKTSR